VTEWQNMAPSYALLLVFLGCVGCIGCSRSPPLPPKAAELNQSGVEALARGDLEVADSRFSLAIEYSPHFVEALTNLGLVELQRGNFERAAALLTKARRVNPDVAQPHHGLGVLSERMGRPDRARDHYQDALRIDPGFVPARANLARLLFGAGELEQARIEFSKLIEAAPDDPSGHAGLAESLIRLGRIVEADTVVEQAQGRFPESAEIRILWCRRLLRRGQTTDAIQGLSALANKRDDLGVAALGWLAAATLAEGRPREALHAARRALSLKSDNEVAAYVVTEASNQLENRAHRTGLRRARSIAAEHPDRVTTWGQTRRDEAGRK
jgi:protein O-GlcNAc transferase